MRFGELNECLPVCLSNHNMRRMQSDDKNFAFQQLRRVDGERERVPLVEEGGGNELRKNSNYKVLMDSDLTLSETKLINLLGNLSLGFPPLWLVDNNNKDNNK